MNQVAVRVLLVVDSPRIEREYRRAIEEQGAVCDSVSSVASLLENFSLTLYNGILVDVPTAIRATAHQGEILNHLSQSFPAARILWDRKRQFVRILATGRIAGRKLDLKRFLGQVCLDYPGRTIRLHRREDLFLRVRIRATGEASREEASVTFDISQGGCFLFSARKWEVGQKCFVAMDASNLSLLEGLVRRVRPWEGSVDGPPGIGIEFVNLSEEQQSYLFEQAGRTVDS